MGIGFEFYCPAALLRGSLLLRAEKASMSNISRHTGLFCDIKSCILKDAHDRGGISSITIRTG